MDQMDRIEQWVPFAEGDYIVVRGILVSPEGQAVEMEKPTIQVFADSRGLRSVHGSGMIRPAALVELHETEETVDLLLDLGNDFIYAMERPTLKSGKVFAPDVRALLQFSPTRPWTSMTGDAFENRVGTLRFL